MSCGVELHRLDRGALIATFYGSLAFDKADMCRCGLQNESVCANQALRWLGENENHG